MVSKTIRTLFTISMLLMGVFARAQTYPIQTFLQLSPPYSGYLPDYADPFNEQMKVIITLNDLTVPSLDVKLKFRIEGNGFSMETKSTVNFPPVNLSPGVPLQLSGFDLAPYLLTQNLQFSGVNPNNYETRKVLPEGPYTICVSVYDYYHPNQVLVSNVACVQAWFSLQEPPLLNMPMCGSSVSPQNPQQITFSWASLNGASPNSFGQTEYLFELFEVRPPNSDPNIVVNTTVPLFTVNTSQTILNYGLTEPALQVGMQYVWRVTVMDQSGRDHFRNGGVSQVCGFTYGDIGASMAQGLSLQLNAQGTAPRQGTAYWNAQGAFSSYTLEVRKTGNSGFAWFPHTCNGGQLKINNLEPQTEYECRVKGHSGNYESEWSNTVTFTTPALAQYACNSNTMPPTDAIIKPLPSAHVGMVFTVGQFDMTVTDIQNAGAPGRYSGLGKVLVPFLMLNLNVSYTNVLVDENLAVRDGKVQVLTQGVNAWLHEQYAGLVDPIYVEGTITSTSVQDSICIIVTSEGTIEIPFPDNDLPIIVIDESGNVYTIWIDGTVTVSTTFSYSSDHLNASAGKQVRFRPYADQHYGYDVLKHMALGQDYEVIQLSDSSKYFVPFKSVKKNGSDSVWAHFSFIPEANQPIGFYDGNHLPLNFTKVNDTSYLVHTPGRNNNYEIYAEYGAGQYGKLNVHTYQSIKRKVRLVPVGNFSLNATNIIQELNNIYANAVVAFEVQVDTSVLFGEWDLNDNGLDTANATLMNHYSAEMKSLRDFYLSGRPSPANDELLIFIVDRFADPAMQGYMVRNRSVGFLARNAPVRVLAHEIGHGAFALQHTFPTIALGSSENLMDYASGTALFRKQWFEIHSQSPSFTFMDDEEEGAFYASPFYSTSNESSEGEPNFNLPGVMEIPATEIPQENPAVFRSIYGGFIKLGANEIAQINYLRFKNGTLFQIINKEGKSLKLSSNGFVLGKNRNNGTREAIERTGSATFIDYSVAHFEEKVLYEGITYNCIKPLNCDIIGEFIACSQTYYAPTSELKFSEQNNYCPSSESSDCDIITQINTEDLSWVKFKLLELVDNVKNVGTKPLSEIPYDYVAKNNRVDYKTFSDEDIEIINERCELMSRMRQGRYFFVIEFDSPEDGIYEIDSLEKIAKDALQYVSSQNPGIEIGLLLVNYNQKYHPNAINQKYTYCENYVFETTDNNKLRRPDYINNARKPIAKSFDYFESAFSNFLKPYLIRNVYLHKNGKITSYSISSMGNANKDEFGFSQIAILRYFESNVSLQEISIVDNAMELFSAGYNSWIESDSSILNSEIESIVEEYNRLDEFNSSFDDITNPDLWFFSEINDKIKKYRERYFLSETACLKIIHYEGSNKFFTALSRFSFNSDALLLGINPVSFLPAQPATETYDIANMQYDFSVMTEYVDPIFYGVIDIAGLIPYVDNVADGFGLMYSSLRGNGEGVIIYSASLAIPFVGAATIKAGQKVYRYFVKKSGDEVFELTVKEAGTELPQEYPVGSSVVLPSGYTKLAQVENAMEGYSQTLYSKEYLSYVYYLKYSDEILGWLKNYPLIRENLNSTQLKYLKERNFSTALLDALENDLQNNTFKLALKENVELVDAWKFVRQSIGNTTNNGFTQFALDPKTLEKVSDMMQPGSGFRNALGSSWQTKLGEILQKHKHLNCETCGGTFVSGPKMEEFLSDVEHFYSNFNPNGKASNYFNWLNRETAGLGEAADIATNNANTSLAEMYQTLYELRRRGLKEVDINKFGASYSNLPNSRQSDILLNNGTHIELKNKKYTSGTTPTEQEIDQIIGVKGAFGNIDDLSKFEWVAFEARGNNLADLKTMWKDVFTTRKNEIFLNMKPELKTKLELISPDDLTSSKIDEILDVIIKVK